jgi:hypothetical protein
LNSLNNDSGILSEALDILDLICLRENNIKAAVYIDYTGDYIRFKCNICNKSFRRKKWGKLVKDGKIHCLEHLKERNLLSFL